ncbi:polymorphic toxin-type HINT domain-containing protein [Paludisphaera borealis]|uniref:Hint domain-containing protein n=1 Tax=Paludisphaera borealis TaxID=1387353 RepID=A0A1U7CJG4_9BACT|nr:polymorphic toxin-type HINT domain-containing protein [Paludisphaera borealis]APW59069.1 hypothetical protein BSF38_00483 [Paludisphaera borealis]
MVSVLVLSWALGVTGASEPEAAKPSGPDLIAYESAKATAGRDADAHVALALWCEAHGMPAEKATHLARAVLIDPSHAKARGLLGYVKHEGKWLRPEEVSLAVEESPESQALFREYLGRRTQSRDKADDQYKLAQWCDEHGLAQQATAHYHRVIELDPGRDLAWKHLGFKKVSGQWVKPELLAAQKVEREAQAKSDKFWKPKLEHLKSILSGRDKAKKVEAEKTLAAIVDPRAVPMVWAVFAHGSERWQSVATGIFGRIDAPGASAALAMMAVFSPVANVRSEASQLLTRRDPREFARLLANLLRDEIKYKVKPVEGPGSQGELFVEGKYANVRRVYTPLQSPWEMLMPGDLNGVDANGSAVVYRPLGTTYLGSLMSVDQRSQSNLGPVLDPYFQKLGLSPQQSQTLVHRMETPISGGIAANASSSTSSASTSASSLAGGLTKNGSAAVFPSNIRPVLEDFASIPFQQMIAEAQRSALVARRQLAQDVEQIDSHNAPIRDVNERVAAILTSVSGRDFGDDRDKWMEWVCDVEGYVFPLKIAASAPPTIDEAVPLGYQPQTFPVAVVTRTVGFQVSHSCFAGGTLVRTLRGTRPIEEVMPGDQVLTADTSSGSLQYRPVVRAYRNPPNETYRLDLGKESIVATGIHRFWKAGHGWIMAREIKAGDRLRTIGGAAEVVAVTKDQVQPVFNLQLDGGDDFCVGELGVIAHDNSFVNPVERPFDGVPTLADLGSTHRP